MSTTPAAPPAPSAPRHTRNRWGWWLRGLVLAGLTLGLAFGLRMLEWPVWQNPEYRLGEEWLLATHDAYHWVAGAEGFEFGTGHPMSEMLRIMAGFVGTYPAAVAFWFPAVLASLVAVMVFAWAWALGALEVGVAAGVLASLAPGFMARTLLGYYDTDLVTLFFPLSIALAPACWAMRFLLLPHALLTRIFGEAGTAVFPSLPGGLSSLRENSLAWPWILALALSGLLAWWTQAWHSVFPYLVRYNVCLLAVLALLLAPRGRRRITLLGASAYALPAVWGIWGLVGAALPLLAGLGLARELRQNRVLTQVARSSRQRLRTLAPVLLLWGVVVAGIVNGEILDTLTHQIGAYVKTAEDIKTQGGESVSYPSVAQSIIEVQDLELGELFSYFHPLVEAAVLGFAGFFVVLFLRPGALFLLPLAALGILSMKLGGRMVMFGAPITALGLALPTHWLVQRALPQRWRGGLSGGVTALLLLAFLAAPFVELIPAMSQGPMLDRRHAAGLARLRQITPEDAMIWIWWDWGYATHHFARRKTIADGAAHGGASLYLPAAVFATHDPRFARQLIKYTALKGNEPGQAFAGLGNAGADDLIRFLKNPETPLLNAPGKQYMVVSFEMVRLGFWISTFGCWDFLKREGQGYALSIVPQPLSYRLNTGEVLVQGNVKSIPATRISVFEDGRMVHRDYVQEWFDKNPGASREKERQFLDSRRNVNFLFNRVTGEKLVVDEALYSTLMVRLLVDNPTEKYFAPYFKIVYDNAFVRIYEVL